MSILIYAESDNGKIRKGAFEIASYAKGIADQMSSSVTAVVVNADNADELFKYGVSKVLSVKNESLNSFSVQQYASVVSAVAESESAQLVVLSSSADSKYLAPFVGVKLSAAVVSNVVSLPKSVTPFVVERTAFTNKAFQLTEVNSEVKVLSLSSNSFGIIESSVEGSIEDFAPEVGSSGTTVTGVDKATDKVSIADAEVVVSGGRGLKGPENWNLIEDLADVLGAATACSKPVSDMGWRPHGEHVGQTGKPVASNLYIAIGISGAIQHLAGINASKVKVVINTDPEAPFFKAADYGIVGDAFEVVPKLIDKLKAFKAVN